MSDEFVSGNELAKRLGISETMVRKHRASGLLMPEARGANKGKYHVQSSFALFENNRDPDAAIKGIASGAAVSVDSGSKSLPENSLTRARTAQAALRAQREHLALQKDKGELIRTEDAFKACRAVVSIVLERLDGAAAQIGARVAGLDAVAAERVAREVLAAVRSEIAGMSGAIQEVQNGSRATA